MKRARFIAPTRREFLSQISYINGKKSGLGGLFAAAIQEATTRPATLPITGSPASKNIRRVFVKDFPFAVVCRPDANGIVIFAVAHHSRGLEYWQSRFQNR